MFKKLLILPAAFLAFACSKGDSKMTASDSALNSDLSTAAASRPYTPLDSITAAERAGVATSTAPTALRSTSTAPRTTVRRTTTTRRSTRSGSSGTYSSAPVYSAPAPQPTVVKHTKRDAAIGAGAGAVIGAVTSRNKVKGAIIGGAAGAILGGIIGNNVDKTKK
ncbi:MAG TPA: YMGG-like glycine zipper-containing protein [Gemmatimonadaceae bacterium]|nr:YMGG-like glycine zipper-containing protein [Gemmatimonadaceae bacterium]